VRRANAYHILSLIIACMGTAAWACAADLDGQAMAAAAGGAVSLLLTAAGFATLAVRRGRLEREALVRHLRHAAAGIRPDDARYNAPTVDADSFGAAVDGLIAAGRTLAISLGSRNRELEVQLRAAVLERDHAQATVATMAEAVRSVGASCYIGPCDGSQPADAAQRAAATSQVSVTVAPAQPPTTPTATWEGTREAARLKSEFVSLVSHELRTPLASIRAYAEMLIDGEAVDEQSRREFFRVLHTEAGRLEQSVENVLTLARLEAGLLQPARRPTP
jgi:signal transduction histidine kinase